MEKRFALLIVVVLVAAFFSSVITPEPTGMSTFRRTEAFGEPTERVNPGQGELRDFHRYDTNIFLVFCNGYSIKKDEDSWRQYQTLWYLFETWWDELSYEQQKEEIQKFGIPLHFSKNPFRTWFTLRWNNDFPRLVGDGIDIVQEQGLCD